MGPSQGDFHGKKTHRLNYQVNFPGTNFLEILLAMKHFPGLFSLGNCLNKVPFNLHEVLP